MSKSFTPFSERNISVENLLTAIFQNRVWHKQAGEQEGRAQSTDAGSSSHKKQLTLLRFLLKLSTITNTYAIPGIV